jgi:hypothetical protein
VSGTDNETADSRLRYYGYLGTSSTAKSVVVTTNHFADASPGSWPMDSRLKATDNFTVSAGVANTVFGAGDGSITHLIVCPGNEAGDATSCASAAINDRGSATAVSLADNASELVMTYALSSGFGMLRDFSSSAKVYSQALSHSKGGATALSGSAGTVVSTGKTAVADLQGFDMTSSGGTSAYFIAPATGDSDNYTLVTITSSGSTSASIDNITDASGSSSVRISEGTDGIYASIASNDNVTMTAIKIASGSASFVGTDNLTISTTTTASNPHCSSAHPSGGALAAAWIADNESLMSATVTSGAAWSIVNEVLAQAGGTDASIACDMTFASDGTAYLIAVADNGTGVLSYSSADNGSSWSAISPVKGDPSSGAIKDIAIVIDTGLNLPVVAANVNATVNVFALDNSSGTNVWTDYITSGATNASSRVSISAMADGSVFAVGYPNATPDNATVQVFYDE